MLFDEEQITVTVTAALAAKTALIIKPGDENLQNKAGLYPNPVTGKFMVKLDRSYANISGIITDMNGVIVKRLAPGNISAGKLEIEVSALSAGTYIMKLESGTKKWVFKFLKL